MEQIANLSTGNRCQGSNPCLSAEKPGQMPGFFMSQFWVNNGWIVGHKERVLIGVKPLNS